MALTISPLKLLTRGALSLLANEQGASHVGHRPGTALCDDIAGFDAESGSESSHVAFKNLLLYARTLGHCHWQRRMPNCRRKI